MEDYSLLDKEWISTIERPIPDKFMQRFLGFLNYNQQSEFIIRLLKIFRTNDKFASQDIKEVEYVAEYLTVKEILEVGQDPSYYVHAKELHVKDNLLKAENWARIGNRKVA